MARKIKADEKDKPCDPKRGGAVVPNLPLPYGDEQYREEFWRCTAKVWYDRCASLEVRRNRVWKQWQDKYFELKRFKLANFSTKDILVELDRRGVKVDE